MAFLCLQNRWEIFDIEEEGCVDSESSIAEHAEMKSVTRVDEVEGCVDSESLIVEHAEMKSVTRVDDEECCVDSIAEHVQKKAVTVVDEVEDTGTWQVDNARSRRTRTRKRRPTEPPPIVVELPPTPELPLDILSLIFRKLKPLEILDGAQWVCSSWRKLSREPYLFRSIDLRNYWKSSQTEKFIKMVMTAVDRSCGELDEFSIADYYGEDLLNYVFDKSNSIKCLRFVKCYGLVDDLLLKFVRKFSDIEELELSYCRISEDAISEEAIAEVGQLCSKLTCFRWVGNKIVYNVYQYALVIAENMPKLRHLQFYGFLSDDGLQAILNGCRNLEYLDLRRCYEINLTGEAWQKCVGRIRHVRHPDDPVDDWDYALKRCDDYMSWSTCGCGHCSRSFFYYDPDVEEKDDVEYDYDDDDDFENQIFLPPKSVTCYL